MVLALMGSLGIAEVFVLLIVFLVGALILVTPAWRICTRVGYPGGLGVLILVPVLNLALLYFIAFATWPIEQQS